MRGGVALFAALLALLPASVGSAMPVATQARPVRILSMNLCTDQLLLALVGPDRIASVTWMARDPQDSIMAKAAMRVPVNHGQAEDVLREQPDLILTGAYSTPAVRALLQRLHYPLVVVPEATSFAGIRSATRTLAAAVGERAKGEALIARMDAQLAELARNKGSKLRVAAWDGSGFNATRGSLYNEVLEVAGAVNVANEPPASGYATPDTEVLLAAAPDLLVQGVRGAREVGQRDNLARHRLVRRYWGVDRTVWVPQSAYMCGTPFVAESALALQRKLRATATRARSRLPFRKAMR